MYGFKHILFLFIAYLLFSLQVSQAGPLPSDTITGIAKKPGTSSVIQTGSKKNLPPAALKNKYCYQFNIRGQAPAGCEMISGSLPSGLTLTAKGFLSGSPLKTGTFLFTVKLTDRKKHSAEQRCCLTVEQPTPSPPRVTSGSKTKPVKTIKGSAARKPNSETFEITKVHLYFEKNHNETAARSKKKGLAAYAAYAAYAAISFEGSGWLEGYWQREGKIVSRVREHLDSGKTIPGRTTFSPSSAPLAKGNKRAHPKEQTDPDNTMTLNKPGSVSFSSSARGQGISPFKRHPQSGRTVIIKAPDLPLVAAGGGRSNRLKFIITSPTHEVFSLDEMPVARVAAEQTPVISLVAPQDRAEVEYSPVIFRWKAAKGARSYSIEIMDSTAKKIVFSVDTTTPEYELLPSKHEKVIPPHQEYTWRVTSSDEKGSLNGKSPDYHFTFLAPSGHVSGQILLVVEDAGNAERLLQDLARKYNLSLVKMRAIRSLRQRMAVFSTEADILITIKAIKRERSVVLAQPNNIFRTMTEPMSAMQNVFSVLNLEKLHEHYTGKEVTVGIVDTGVDTHHKDLRGRVIGHENFIDNSHYKGEIHGTAVAGIIGAGLNDFGIAGVAPDAKILALRACRQVSKAHPEGRCETYAISRALDTSIERDANIVNMSFGSPAPDPLLRRLVEEGTRRGMVFVAPVGNRAEQKVLWFPASHKDVLAVAGTDEAGRPYPNAEIASKADVCAPSANIFTAIPGQNHNFLQGTSMSAAVVSGLVALAHSKYGRIKASQLPSFKGDLCEWEQDLMNIPLCDKGL